MNIIIERTTATSGSVSVINTQQDLVVIHDAGVTAALTINMPSNPKDGQIFTLCSSGGIVSLTLSAVATIANTLGAMAAGANGTWIYSAAGSKWYKIR